MITLATRPAAPAPKPGTAAASSRSGPQPAAAPSYAGALNVPASLNLGAGSSGEITITAVGGSVRWSATASPARWSA